MASRRNFLACAICAAVGAAVGLVATGVDAPAQAQVPGVVRKTLSTIDFPGDGKHSILMTVELAAGTAIARHTHPGLESTVVTEGELELEMQGHPARLVKAGDGFQVPAGLPHSARSGGAPTRLAVTYVVDKDKPLASPA
jgi:quercetin dioxygenase-like cupin family protein